MSDPDTQAGTGTADAAPPAEGGQAENGQGQGTGIEGLYTEALSSVPEELHPQVTEALKRFDGGVTRKLQEAADYRKRWEPYEQVEGFGDVPAEELPGLVQWGKLLDDVEQAAAQLNEGQDVSPEGQAALDQFEDWWVRTGTALGLLDDDGEGEPSDGEGGGDGDDTSLVAELRERIDQLENGWKQREAQTEQQQRVAQVQQAYEARMSELVTQHGLTGEDGEPDPDAVTAITRFARDYLDTDDPIGKAVEDYLRMTGKAQSELVTDRLAQPAGSTGGGAPDTATAGPRSFKDAKAAAMQRFGAGVT